MEAGGNEWVAAQIAASEPDATVSVEGGTIRVTKPRPTVAADVAAKAGAQAGDVPPIAVIAYVTESKRAALVAFCKEAGIRGRCVSTHGRPLEVRRWDE